MSTVINVLFNPKIFVFCVVCSQLIAFLKIALVR
jgi:hypothetical protein